MSVFPFAQDFDALQNECLVDDKLFVDPLFPAEDLSINLQPLEESIVWKRPREISTLYQAKFNVDGFSRFDVKQGEVGDCW